MYPNDDANYANGRLANTIIRHDKKAVLVSGVHLVSKKKPLQVVATELLTNQVIEDEIDNFDLTPIPLGYVNIDNPKLHHKAIYMARQALRHDWRQGFRKEQALFLVGPKQWDMKAIAKTAEGIFPTIEEARKSFDGEDETIAWCREFAIDKNDNIFYRSFGKIGNFIRDTKDYLLDNKFFWVEEQLRDAVK